ncbi:MAG: signal peptide peptidase SppA, partial [Kordiimonas sp.]
MKGIWALIKSIGTFIQGLGSFTIGALVLLVIGIFVMNANSNPRPTVPDGSVLLLWPDGNIVEQVEFPDPLETAFPQYSNRAAETSIHDITRALKRAKNDNRIAALALITDSMAGAAPSHLHTIAASIRDFKESGKKVYALSTAYSQSDYLLAAEADKVFMNPAGNILMAGYGAYPTYFKSMLDKIGASVNVFRVGTFKAAVEPFIRDDMSDAAKEANLHYLGSLWNQYTSSIESARGMEAGTLQNNIVSISDQLSASGGDFGKLALQTGLVDELSPRKAWRQALIEEYGFDSSGTSFKQFHYQAYLAATDRPEPDAKHIAVITAQGPIVMGDGPVTVTAAETVVGYIREARNNQDTGAILLRINSGGGSAFASELIRQELVAAQEQGIKVIASMGPVAASGGYWISATADEIWAAPSTITGSIGIFGMVPTYENTLDKVGIHTDVVGTTPLAGAFNITRPMSDLTKNL